MKTKKLPSGQTALKVFSLSFFLLTSLCFFTPFLSAASAADVTLAWDANSESNLSGYKLYYKAGESGAPYDGTGLTDSTGLIPVDSSVIIDLDDLSDTSAPTVTLTGLEEGTKYYFALTAFDTDGLESDYSDEVAYETEATVETAYSIIASATGQGSLSPEGTVSVTEGGSQTFTITADENYHIASVTVDGSSMGQIGSYTFEGVSEDHTISAVFEIDTYTVVATAGENGAISPAAVTSVGYGGSLTFAITPDDGYDVSDVLVDGSSVGAVSAYSFENINTWHSIKAVFEAEEIEIYDGATEEATAEEETTNDGTSEEATADEETTNDGATEEATAEEETTNDEITGEATDEDAAEDETTIAAPVAVDETLEADALGSVELAVGDFSSTDTDVSHKETEWQVFRADDDICVLGVVSSTYITTFTVPEIMLDENTSYYWHARFIDSNDTVSEWSQAAYFTTGASQTDTDGNGINDEQEVDTSVDLNGDGLPDAQQEIIKSIVLPDTNEPVGLDIEASETVMAILYMEAVDADSLSVNSTVKTRIKKMPTGLINYKLEVAEPGDTAVVTIRFSEAMDPDSKWMKLDLITGTWIDYSGYSQLSSDCKSMTLELVDGGYGDDDGVANGVIVDPAGIEMAAGAASEDEGSDETAVSDVVSASEDEESDEADASEAVSDSAEFSDDTGASDSSDSGSGCFITGSMADDLPGIPAAAGILLFITLGAILVPALERKRK